MSYNNQNQIQKTKEDLNYTTSYTYSDESCINKPISITNINNQTTTYEYDTLCKQIKQTEPNARETQTFYDDQDETIDLGIDYQNVGFDSIDGLKSVYSITTRTNTGLWSKRYFNRFGKVIRAVKIGDDNRKIYKDTIYNKRGLKKAVSMPYFKGKIIDNTNYIEYRYDLLNRVVKKLKPGNNGQVVTLYDYDGLKSSETKPNGVVKTTYKDILNNPIKVTENDSTILYKYDSHANLIQTNTNGKIIDITYDILNKKTSLKDPSAGLIRYEYNLYNNLINQTDNKNETTSMSYDKLGRVVKKTTPEGITTFSYDSSSYGIGKLSSTTNPNSSVRYEYDNFARLFSKIKTIDAKEFETQYAYNSNNQITNTSYPSDLNVKKEYDANGKLKNISIPKKDIWDYDYLALEISFQMTLRRIADLERKAITYETKAKEYMNQALKYKEYAKLYQAKSDKHEAEVDSLTQIATQVQKQADINQRNASKYRKLANKYYKKFGNVSLKYVSTENGKHYYANNNCTNTNWKGQCIRKRGFEVSLPTWMIEDETYYVPGAKSCGWKSGCRSTPGHYATRPQSTINVSDIYNKWANYYQKRSDEDPNKSDQEKADSHLQVAKEYAKMAREQTNILLDITNELKVTGYF